MPARKNRPGKHGVDPLHVSKETKAKRGEVIEFFKRCERQCPGESHYTPWKFVADADQLVREELLYESDGRGCYRITRKFWVNFLSPTR